LAIGENRAFIKWYSLRLCARCDSAHGFKFTQSYALLLCNRPRVTSYRERAVMLRKRSRALFLSSADTTESVVFICK